jgi:hypothetical protein
VTPEPASDRNLRTNTRHGLRGRGEKLGAACPNKGYFSLEDSGKPVPPTPDYFESRFAAASSDML